MNRFFAWMAVPAALLVGGVAMADSCTAVSGPFVNQQVYPPACASAVLICTHGELGGDLEGDYDFAMDTLTPLADPADPLRFDFTGHSLVTRGDGSLTANDHGTLHYNPTGLSPFTTYVVFSGGDGAYAGASGQLVATGEIDFSTGAGEGEYEGEVCLP